MSISHSNIIYLVKFVLSASLLYLPHSNSAYVISYLPQYKSFYGVTFSLIITMLSYKTVIVCGLLISLVSSTDISPKATCEECQEAFGNLVTRLLSEDSLVEQMDLLKTGVCSVLEDPVACNELVDTWWVLMAGVLYPNLMNPQDLCNNAGVCDIAKDWTCEDCVGGIEFASGYFESEESIQAGIDLLSGDSFCGAPGATEDCAEQMAGWLPVAIPVLSAALREQEIQICQEEVGVC